MTTILFLYSLGNLHSEDLSFHVMCCRCCLQLPQFAAHVWMNSMTFAMFHCILYCKLLLVRYICFWCSSNDREDLFFNVMYFLLAMNLSSVRKWSIPTWWLEVREYDAGWSATRSQSILLIFVIRSRINVIKLCSLSLWTTHVRIISTPFSSHSPKAKFMHAKVTSRTHT